MKKIVIAMGIALCLCGASHVIAQRGLVVEVDVAPVESVVTQMEVDSILSDPPKMLEDSLHYVALYNDALCYRDQDEKIVQFGYYIAAVYKLKSLDRKTSEQRAEEEMYTYEIEAIAYEYYTSDEIRNLLGF